MTDQGQQPRGRMARQSPAGTAGPGMSSLAIPIPDDWVARQSAAGADPQRAPRPSGASEPAPLAHLALRSASGDRNAFAALHQRLGGGLFRLFLERTGGRSELADDFSQ